MNTFRTLIVNMEALKMGKSTASDKRYYAKVAKLGCIVCLNNGYQDTPPEIHHIRLGGGMGLKSSNRDVIPLCHAHHRTGGYGTAFHAGQLSFESNFGTESELLEQVKGML